jgi:hypothetical protein
MSTIKQLNKKVDKTKNKAEAVDAKSKTAGDELCDLGEILDDLGNRLGELGAVEDQNSAYEAAFSFYEISWEHGCIRALPFLAQSYEGDGNAEFGTKPDANKAREMRAEIQKRVTETTKTAKKDFDKVMKGSRQTRGAVGALCRKLDGHAKTLSHLEAIEEEANVYRLMIKCYQATDQSVQEMEAKIEELEARATQAPLGKDAHLGSSPQALSLSLSLSLCQISLSLSLSLSLS